MTEHIVTAQLLYLKSYCKANANERKGTDGAARTVHLLERLLQLAHQRSRRSALARTQIRRLHRVHHLRNLVDHLDHRVRVAGVHQID